MKYTSLTYLEINDLIRKYQSELRKLEFQISHTKKTISELQNLQQQGSTELDVHPSSSPAEEEIYEFPAEEKVEKKNQRKKQNQTESKKEAVTLPKQKRGYRLSEWDLFILEKLEEKGHILVNADFFDLALPFVKEKNLDLDDTQIRGKISRSIHKLANKRNEIIKTNFPGKGYAYGLKSWFNAQGKLKKKYFKNL